MATWDKGEQELSCDHCGAIHVADYSDFPNREKGAFDCLSCGQLLLRWNGTRDYHSLRLKDDAQGMLNAMPVILHPEECQRWLDGEAVEHLAAPSQVSGWQQNSVLKGFDTVIGKDIASGISGFDTVSGRRNAVL